MRQSASVISIGIEMKKSLIIQLILTVFLGPLGLFYSSVAAALSFLALLLLLGVISGGLVFVLSWPLAILIGFITVYRHNRQVNKEDRKHQELLEVIRSQSKLDS